MATVALFDFNLGGPAIYRTQDEPETEQEYLADHVGTWFDPTGDGALLIGDEWSALYFKGDHDDVTDIYPDYVLDSSGVEVA